MNIFFSLLTVFGAIALFLYGMKLMGGGLEKLSGGRLEKTLEKLTSSPVKAVLLGAGVTAVIQSSSATTVTVVGFVNSGIMKLSQAVGIIMGANVGTTATGWLLSTAGIDGEGFWANLFKPTTIAPAVAVAGILLSFSKRDSRKNIATICLGFAILMFAMSTISATVSPLKDQPAFRSIISTFNNPILAILSGAVITAVLQSSSASVGILQAMSVAGGITCGFTVPIIMGMNIGASVPALLSSIGAKVDAKRAAFVYLYFNIIGTVICLPLYYLVEWLILRTLGTDIAAMNAGAVNIAVINTIIKVVSTLILLPFTGLLCKLVELTIRDRNVVCADPLLEERFLKTPLYAIEQSRSATYRMADTARDVLFDAMRLVENYDDKLAASIPGREEVIDSYEDKLGVYLVKLSSSDLSVKDSNEIAKLLRTIGDFERIGDHAVNILDAANEIHDKKIIFSPAAIEELSILSSALREIVDLTITAFEHEDAETAKRVEPLEQVIDYLKDELKARHVGRLTRGECTIELGFIFSDLLTNYERVSDHCSNIAVALIEMGDSSIETHGYLNKIKNSGQTEFVDAYQSYAKKYSLPGRGINV